MLGQVAARDMNRGENRHMRLAGLTRAALSLGNEFRSGEAPLEQALRAVGDPSPQLAISRKQRVVRAAHERHTEHRGLRHLAIVVQRRVRISR